MVCTHSCDSVYARVWWCALRMTMCTRVCGSVYVCVTVCVRVWLVACDCVREHAHTYVVACTHTRQCPHECTFSLHPCGSALILRAPRLPSRGQGSAPTSSCPQLLSLSRPWPPCPCLVPTAQCPICAAPFVPLMSSGGPRAGPQVEAQEGGEWFCHPWEPAVGAAPQDGEGQLSHLLWGPWLCGAYWSSWQEGSRVTGSGSRSSWTGDGRW